MLIREQEGQNPEEAAKAGNQEAAGGQEPRETGDVDVGSGAEAPTSTTQEAAEQNVPEETRSQTREWTSNAAERTKSYLSEKVPEQRRDQFIARVKKMIVEIQGHSDCKCHIATIHHNGR